MLDLAASPGYSGPPVEHAAPPSPEERVPVKAEESEDHDVLIDIIVPEADLLAELPSAEPGILERLGIPIPEQYAPYFFAGVLLLFVTMVVVSLALAPKLKTPRERFVHSCVRGFEIPVEKLLGKEASWFYAFGLPMLSSKDESMLRDSIESFRAKLVGPRDEDFPTVAVATDVEKLTKWWAPVVGDSIREMTAEGLDERYVGQLRNEIFAQIAVEIMLDRGFMSPREAAQFVYQTNMKQNEIPF